MVAVEEGRSNGSFSTSRKFGEVIDEFMSSGPQIDRNDFQSILKGLLLFYLFGGLYKPSHCGRIQDLRAKSIGLR